MVLLIYSGIEGSGDEWANALGFCIMHSILTISGFYFGYLGWQWRCHCFLARQYSCQFYLIKGGHTVESENELDTWSALMSYNFLMNGKLFWSVFCGSLYEYKYNDQHDRFEWQ